MNKIRPYTASETLLLEVFRVIYPDVMQLELRREFSYLADRKMVELEKRPFGDWFADLSRLGVDIVEYTVECGPGIARLEKHWSERLWDAVVALILRRRRSVAGLSGH